MIVELSPEAWRRASLRGTERNDIAERNKAANLKVDENTDDLTMAILGALGEEAAGLALDPQHYRVPPNNEWSGDDGIDLEAIASTWQVKTTKNPRAEYLIARRLKRRARGLVFVRQLTQLTYDVIGVISMERFLAEREWLDWMPRPCWGVHQETLVPTDIYVCGRTR